MFTHQQCLFGIQKLGRIQSLKSKYSNNILSSNIFPKRQKTYDKSKYGKLC